MGGSYMIFSAFRPSSFLMTASDDKRMRHPADLFQFIFGDQYRFYLRIYYVVVGVICCFFPLAFLYGWLTKF